MYNLLYSPQLKGFSCLIMYKAYRKFGSTCTNSIDKESHGTCTNSLDEKIIDTCTNSCSVANCFIHSSSTHTRLLGKPQMSQMSQNNRSLISYSTSRDISNYKLKSVLIGTALAKVPSSGQSTDNRYGRHLWSRLCCHPTIPSLLQS